MFTKKLLVGLLAFVVNVSAHYTFPALLVNGVNSGDWVNVRKTNNFNSRSPVTDVSSVDLRCYTSETGSRANTIDVSAGSQIGFQSDGTAYHLGVANIYMAKAPSGTNVADWDGDGNVWFKVHEITAVTDGGNSIKWPAEGLASISFTIPNNIPSGEYLVRIEHIALHGASSFQGAQFYISCGQVNVTNGGNGTPGPLVAIPGVYTGREPGLMLNVYYPIPATYTQPGPAVWRG